MSKEIVYRYRKNNPWAVCYFNLKSRCERKDHPRFKHYGARGIRCNISLKEVKELWFRDGANLMKKPSIDRIDNDKSYTRNNCRFIELSLNTTLGNNIRWSKYRKEKRN